MANFYVLRETAMHALLSENGFIDNEQDAALMKQSSWRQKVAQGHANGIAKAFNLKRKQQQNDPSTDTEYKVIAGSFKSRDNADERVTFLRSKGIESFVDTVSISGVTWYRVQAGAFSSLDNAEKHLEEVKMTGIRDAFIIAEDSSGTDDAEIPS
jgi:N-acetylmuramoyl-L-alanine amidase